MTIQRKQGAKILAKLGMAAPRRVGDPDTNLILPWGGAARRLTDEQQAALSGNRWSDCIARGGVPYMGSGVPNRRGVLLTWNKGIRCAKKTADMLACEQHGGFPQLNRDGKLVACPRRGKVLL